VSSLSNLTDNGLNNRVITSDSQSLSISISCDTNVNIRINEGDYTDSGYSEDSSSEQFTDESSEEDSRSYDNEREVVVNSLTEYYYMDVKSHFNDGYNIVKLAIVLFAWKIIGIKIS
jgi:hypothetical protein